VRRENGLLHRVRARGHEFLVDEPREAGGGDQAASPLELLASALGACTAATLELYAARKSWELGAVEVDVELVPAAVEEPARFTIAIRLEGDLDEPQLERLEQVARACPVRRALEGSLLSERLELVR
jgi:putative redox protein